MTLRLFFVDLGIYYISLTFHNQLRVNILPLPLKCNSCNSVSSLVILPSFTFSCLLYYICIRYKSYNAVLKKAVFFFCFVLFFLRATGAAYGSSQARGRIRTTAAGLCHILSNTRSKLHLWPTPQLMETSDP